MIPSRFVRLQDPDLDQWLGRPHQLYTSLEGHNPGGSIKDFMVEGAIAALQAAGQLGAGQRITEASAGSTAMSLAYYCGQAGIPVTLFVPDALSNEAQTRLRDLGADVRALAPGKESWEAFDAFCMQPGVIPFRQHADVRKRDYYRELGRRASDALGPVSMLIGAVGTGHSLLGVADGMASRPRVLTAEPAYTAVSGIRNIDLVRHGVDDPCVPELFDQRVLVTDTDFYPSSRLQTSLGIIQFPDSFRVALGAFRAVAADYADQPVFVLGAANSLV